MDIREIEKGIELFYAFLRKNPTLCPHTYIEFSRHSKSLEDYGCKYRLIRILRNCEYCGCNKVEYILVDVETGKELDTDSLSLSTLADFFNGYKVICDKHPDEKSALYCFNAARAEVDALIAQYEKAKKEEEEFQKVSDKIGPLFIQFN